MPVRSSSSPSPARAAPRSGFFRLGESPGPAAPRRAKSSLASRAGAFESVRSTGTSGPPRSSGSSSPCRRLGGRLYGLAADALIGHGRRARARKTLNFKFPPPSRSPHRLPRLAPRQPPLRRRRLLDVFIAFILENRHQERLSEPEGQSSSFRTREERCGAEAVRRVVLLMPAAAEEAGPGLGRTRAPSAHVGIGDGIAHHSVAQPSSPFLIGLAAHRPLEHEKSWYMPIF